MTRKRDSNTKATTTTTAKPNDKATISIVLKQATIEQVKSFAQTDERNVSSMVQVLLNEAIEARTTER